MTIDRTEVSRSLAKAIAFKNCGKDKEAQWWARQLVHQLQCAEILGEEGDDTTRIMAANEIMNLRKQINSRPGI